MFQELPEINLFFSQFVFGLKNFRKFSIPTCSDLQRCQSLRSWLLQRPWRENPVENQTILLVMPLERWCENSEVLWPTIFFITQKQRAKKKLFPFLLVMVKKANYCNRLFTKIPPSNTVHLALWNLSFDGEEWHGFDFDCPINEVVHLSTAWK